LLGIIAHSSLAMGVVVLALSDSIRVNLEAYLFGALLTISSSELLWVVAIAAFVSLILYLFWNDLLSATVHAEIAEIEGTNVRRLNLILVLLIALVVSVSMKIVGVLLITSLLIIPPAAARGLAQTPEQMAIKASCIGSLSIVTGLTVAFFLDVPVGPAIVVAASAIFLALYFYPGVHKV
jgi:zinc transport system permease protein